MAINKNDYLDGDGNYDLKKALVDELIDGVNIESGANENGRYVKLSDGTQICYFLYNSPLITATTYVTYNWTFPASFVDNNYSVGGIFSCVHQGVGYRNGVIVNQLWNKGNASFYFGGEDLNKGTFNEYMFSLYAIGRWK